MSVFADLTAGTLIIVSILAGLSFLSWTIIFQKARQFRNPEVMPGVLGPEIADADSLEALRTIADADITPAHDRILTRAISFRNELRSPESNAGARLPGAGLRPADMEALQISLEREIGESRSELTEGVSMLAVVATVGPLLGLLGTVTGIMGTFIGIQASGTANIAAVAPGVSEALITTVAGLVVAIPAAVAHQIFTAKADDAEERLGWFAAEAVNVIAREMRR